MGRSDIEGALGRLERLTQEEVRMAAAQGLKATHDVDNKLQGVDNRVQQVAVEMDDQKRSLSNQLGSFAMLKAPAGNQLRKDLRNWLSPPDPSVNYNTSSDACHEGTALWFIGCDAFKDWKVSNSLLWIYGKRTSPPPSSSL